jgi:hypothetical protein
MFVATFDNRARTPYYFIPFIRNTSLFCDLNFITPAKKLPRNTSPISNPLEFELQILDPDSLPKYQYVKKLFDESFVNYSTNNDTFERACFHRWFALNASTTSLCSSDYICLLDTDFLIGMSPSDILEECLQRKENNDIQFIAMWDDDKPSSINPAITIMTKSYLFGFCEYLLTTYFSPSMKIQLLKEYFERIGNGLAGGICDMRALAAYSNLRIDTMFNLRELDNPRIIGNFNLFLDSKVGSTGDWKILSKSGKHTLQIKGESKQLIGTHFQGSAKVYMPLACGINDSENTITRSICSSYLARKKTAFHVILKNLNRKVSRSV